MQLTKDDLQAIRGLMQEELREEIGEAERRLQAFVRDEIKLANEAQDLRIEATIKHYVITSKNELSKEIAGVLDKTVLDQLDNHDERIGNLETAAHPTAGSG